MLLSLHNLYRGLTEEAGQLLLDQFQAAAVGKAFFVQQLRQFRLGAELGFGLLLDFDVHHFFNQLHNDLGIHTCHAKVAISVQGKGVGFGRESIVKRLGGWIEH